MPFGWVLSTLLDEQHLARTAGYCQGRENMLPPDATGMLSATVFMALVEQYRSHDIMTIAIWYTSNNMEELIKREVEHKHCEEAYPNTTIIVKYDITEHIYLTKPNQ